MTQLSFLIDAISARNFSGLIIGIGKRFFASHSWLTLVSRENRIFSEITDHRQLLEKIIIFRDTRDYQEYHAKNRLSKLVNTSEKFLAEIVSIKN